MTAGIIFFNVGTKHIARLAVALHSLRKHYDGRASILNVTDLANNKIIDAIVADSRLAVNAIEIPFNQLRRNSAYVAKAGLWRHSPFDASLLVDSDTLFLKSPQPLLDSIADRAKPGFLVTAFSDWRCDGKIIGGRLERWRGVKCDGLDVTALVDRTRQRKSLAINTGIVGMRCDESTLPTLKMWERLTTAGQRNPFTDELAAQILVDQYPHQLVAETWNSSVLYGADKENAAVLHAHGSKHLRPEMQGRWIAEYNECAAAGVARIGDWAPATDTRLAEFLAASR